MQVMSSLLDGTYHMKFFNNFSRLNYVVSISINILCSFHNYKHFMQFP